MHRAGLMVRGGLHLNPGAVTAVAGMGSHHGSVRGGFLPHQKGGTAVTDVLLGKEGEEDGQRGQKEEKAFHSYGFSPKVVKNGKQCVKLGNSF